MGQAYLAGYSHIELPVFEDTALFARGVGESTDVVSKEMYTFADRGERSVTLRPEGTAGVMRSVIQHNLNAVNYRLSLLITAHSFAMSAHKQAATASCSKLVWKPSVLMIRRWMLK